jgi:hypothetical protein
MDGFTNHGLILILCCFARIDAENRPSGTIVDQSGYQGNGTYRSPPALENYAGHYDGDANDNADDFLSLTNVSLHVFLLCYLGTYALI